MTRSAARAVWENLPTEVSLSILKQLPNLATLHNLLKASPTGYRIFDAYSAEIIESVFASGADHKYTCAIIRFAACLHSGISPPGISDLQTFRAWYAHETTQCRWRPSRWTRAPLRLGQQLSTDGRENNAAANVVVVSASVLRSVLASHHRNERLMRDCLATYLARFRALEPQHLGDPEFVWEGIFHGPDYTEYVGPWELEPEGVPFSKHDIGPPTWCEQQRILRAAWRVQLFGDMKMAGAAGRLGWPEWDLGLLQRLRAEYLLSVVDERSMVQEQPTDTPGRPIDNTEMMLTWLDVEEELTKTVLDYIKGSEEQANVATTAPSDTLLASSGQSAPPPSPEDVLELEWFRSPTEIVFELVYISEYDHNYEDFNNSPLQHVPFEFFRRRGFAIWCEARMQGYGLLFHESFFRRPWTGTEYTPNTLMMAWRSVLDKEELAEVARINRRFYEEGMSRDS